MMQTTISEDLTVSRHPIVDPPVKENVKKDQEAIEMSAAGHESPSASNSRAASIPDSDSDLKARTKRHRQWEKVQFATLCWTMYLAGWNDGSTGPLLPRIQKVYGVGDFNSCSDSEIDQSS